MMRTKSDLEVGTITLSSLHHHCAIITLSPHHDHAIIAASLFHYCTILYRHPSPRQRSRKLRLSKHSRSPPYYRYTITFNTITVS